MTRAREAASELLATYEGEGGKVPPTYLGQIVASLGFTVSEHDDLRDLPDAPQDLGPLSGLIDPPTRMIWVDRSEAQANPRRTRFTIAHEIGHWQLHVGDEAAAFYDPARNLQEGFSDEELPKLEDEANAFARELLMPQAALEEQANETGYDVAELGRRFEVSVPAVRLRLQFLGGIPVWMRLR